MDAFSIVADEVALEGLDGITIPSLWIRLEDRKPKFPLKLDDCTKELIWKSLISNTDLKFYQLPKERQDIELFDRSVYRSAYHDRLNPIFNKIVIMINNFPLNPEQSPGYSR